MGGGGTGNVITESLNTEEGGKRGSFKVTVWGKTQLAITGFEDKRRPETKICLQLLEAGKCNKMSCLLESPNRNIILFYIDFSRVRPISNF